MTQYWQDYDEVYEDEVYDAYEYEYQDVQAASVDQDGGCLLGLLPLAAVLVVSCLLAVFALNFTSPVVALSISRATEEAPSSGDSAAALASEESSAKSDDSNEIKSGSGGKLAPLFTPQVQYWEDLIVKTAKKYRIDPNLVATVMQIESCGDPQARSYAGAAGLFQVMPFHFKGNEDPYDPVTNAVRGIAYLVNALEARSGDTRLALASYNGGITGAGRPESQWAAETKRYAYWASGIYEDAAKGKKKSSRLNEWLGAGGASLCTQASNRIGLAD